MITDGEKEEVHVRYAVCKGVLNCSTTNCNFIGSKSAKKCPTHPTSALVSSGSCPVYIVYIYPTDYKENGKRWITGVTKDIQVNLSSQNLHNHPLPKASRVPRIIQESVRQAVRCNSGITPSQLNLGMSKGLMIMTVN